MPWSTSRVRTLAQLIATSPDFLLSRKLDIMEQICRGLAYAHRMRVIHRDIKPANVMVEDDDTVKILDFGVARLEASGLTISGQVMGTLNYMAPEQLEGLALDERADLFSVGAVMYEILTGRPAFPGREFHEVRRRVLFSRPEAIERICPGIDPALAAIANRALEKDANNRFPDLTVMQREIANFRSKAPGESPARWRPETPSSGTTIRPSDFPRQDSSRLRAQEVRRCLDQAAAAIANADYEAAMASCGEALQLEPENAEALSLQQRAHALHEDARAVTTANEARRLFTDGEATRAIALLEAFSPPHPIAQSALESLKLEAKAREPQRSDPGPRTAARKKTPPPPFVPPPPPEANRRAGMTPAALLIVVAAGASLMLIGGFTYFANRPAVDPPAATASVPGQSVDQPRPAAPPPSIPTPLGPPAAGALALTPAETVVPTSGAADSTPSPTNAEPPRPSDPVQSAAAPAGTPETRGAEIAALSQGSDRRPPTPAPGSPPGRRPIDASRELSEQLDRARSDIARAAYSDAVNVLEPIARDNPNSRDITALLAQAREGLQRAGEAEQAMQAAATLEAAGEWPKALQQYERAEQLSPASAAAIASAVARVREKMHAEGVDAFRRARQYRRTRSRCRCGLVVRKSFTLPSSGSSQPQSGPGAPGSPEAQEVSGARHATTVSTARDRCDHPRLRRTRASGAEPGRLSGVHRSGAKVFHRVPAGVALVDHRRFRRAHGDVYASARRSRRRRRAVSNEVEAGSGRNHRGVCPH